jgi:hypothetical protein
MSTQKQRDASRANGRKSQGPVTAEGKAKTRFNALRHGIHAQTQIMFDESPADLAVLAAEYHEQYAPVNPTERFLVDTLVHNEWRLRRMRRVEAVLWIQAGRAFLAAPEQAAKDACDSGDAFVTGGSAMERLQRIVNSCGRNFHRAMKELQRLQAARPDHPLPAQTEPSTTASESPGPFRDNPEPPANTAPPAAPEANAVRTPAGEIYRSFQQDIAAFDAYFAANRGKFQVNVRSMEAALPTSEGSGTE